jgi:hypothetical protein
MVRLLERSVSTGGRTVVGKKVVGKEGGGAVRRERPHHRNLD